MEKIEGGYYLKARKTQKSDIATKPPHFREIWDWLQKESNHEDKDQFKRGQCVRSYKDIQDGLKWYVGWRKKTYSKNDCESAMKWLKDHTMIHTEKTTRGMVITILNYDYYQTPENYTEAYKKHTRSIQTADTINKNDKNEKNKETIYIAKFSSFEDLTDEVCEQIAKEKSVSVESVKTVRRSIETYCGSKGKTYKNYKMTLYSWLEKDIDSGKIQKIKPKEERVYTITPEQREENLKVIKGLTADIGVTPWDTKTTTN